MTDTSTPAASGPGRRRRKGRGRGEQLMVPEADFRSYYDRPVVRASPWGADIPAYLFLGGLAGGSSLLAAGADLTGRVGLRRVTRGSALAAVSASFVFLVHDLGRPSRFHHMLRVAKFTSPMSVGTWILTAYSPAAGAALAGELPLPAAIPAGVRRLIPPVARAGGLAAAGLAPALASYTAVLLSDTSTPTWHAARDHLPFVFVGSASAAAGGLGTALGPAAESGPARSLAVAGAAVELAVSHRMERRIGVPGEPLHQGRAGRYLTASRWLTAGGAALVALGGRRVPWLARIGGAALVAGSAATRFGIFHAGQQSAADPRYTVVPQRQRLDGQDGAS